MRRFDLPPADAYPREAPRRYWHTMTYACDAGCGTEVVFYLEDGCEGPRDGEPLMTRLPDDHPFNPGEERPWPRTSSGRLVVPVPFIAGICPKCRGGVQRPSPTGQGRPRHAGYLMHVRWGEDRDIYPMATHVPEDAGAFLYPDDLSDPQACGRPVYARGRG